MMPLFLFILILYITYIYTVHSSVVIRRGFSPSSSNLAPHLLVEVEPEQLEAPGILQEWLTNGWKQGCVSGLDPDSIGSVDPDPDPGGQKWPTKVEKNL